MSSTRFRRAPIVLLPRSLTFSVGGGSTWMRDAWLHTGGGVGRGPRLGPRRR